MSRPHLLTFFALIAIAEFTWALDGISIHSPAPDRPFSAMHFRSPIPPELNAVLEYGDTLSGQLLTLQTATNSELRVSIQLESSLSVTNEGPHLDLIDWRECHSDWMLSQPLGNKQFALPDYDRFNTDCSIPATKEEIKAEIYRRGGQIWVEIYEGALDAGYDPIITALSAVKIKIEQQSAEGWQVLTTVVITVPMGC